MGWFHASCVHQIPSGAVVDRNQLVTLKDGTSYQIPKCSHPPYLTLPEAGGATANPGGDAIGTTTDAGWDAWDSVVAPSGDSYRQIVATWHVPPRPVATYHQTEFYQDAYFAFTSLQSPGYPRPRFILQPWLQYGYSYYQNWTEDWTLMAMWCDTLGTCDYGNVIAAAPGDSIIGGVSALPDSGVCTGGVCLWGILAWDVNLGLTSAINVRDSDYYVQANGGVVETEGVIDSRSYFPASWVQFTGIQVSDRYGPVSPSWRAATITSYHNPDCSFYSIPTTSSVILFENAPTATSLSSSPSPPQPNQAFSLTIAGSYFEPDSVQIFYHLTSCSPGYCNGTIPNSSLSGKTYTQLTVASMTLGNSGTWAFQVRNSPGGPLSNPVQLLVQTPTLSVSINGPTLVPARRQCTWTAATSGGTPPYTYAWNVNGSGAGDGSDALTITTPSSAFTIGVTASDANSLQGQASLSVRIGGSSCQS